MGDWLEKAYGPAAGQVGDRIRRSFEGGTGGTEVELVIRTRDGESRIWTFTAGEPGRLPDGRRFLVTMATDVTERRQADEALRDSQERLRMAVEATGLGTWDFNPIPAGCTWSERCKEIHGLPPDAEVDYGEYLLRVHPGRLGPGPPRGAGGARAGGPGRLRVEYRSVAPDGAVRWITSRGRSSSAARGRTATPPASSARPWT